ncbi:hypothetical protein COU79_01610 [Candidatus Peregrinibacteria bacterium CG10_big_fil_rev_8_21_14_0_10_54_7]|nr:MAG: hypothetical protein COU79_01610 [Candidatus Peregrinibacteria bacterium CG10_big_fil_rev_8_21_14_0_10_54_7]
MPQAAEGEPSQEFSLPTVVEGDLEEIPGVEVGTDVTMGKIDPATGEFLAASFDFNGKVARGQLNIEGRAGKGCALYVRPQGADKSNHTSTIQRIDRMSDGSFWLHTVNSVYRLMIGAAGELGLSDAGEDGAERAAPVIEVDREGGGTPAGGQRVKNRSWLSWILRRRN